MNKYKIKYRYGGYEAPDWWRWQYSERNYNASNSDDAIRAFWKDVDKEKGVTIIQVWVRVV